MPAPDRLKRRLALAFEFRTPDERDLTASILGQRTETWRAVMTAQARGVGSSKTGTGPSGRDLSELSRLSRRDAQSIVQTFNRELGNQIDRLYDANPTGDRAYYVRELTAWADQRAAYKDRQIANMNRSSARTYAMDRFEAENQIGPEALYVFDGPPPRESICAGLMERGAVTRDVARANPTPIHINCPHSWRRLYSSVTVDVNDLWVGG